MNRKVFGVPGLGLCLGFLLLLWENPARGAEEGRTWRAVQEQAKASGEPKALWKELKKLTPTELLECCDSCAQEALDAGLDSTSVIIPINAMLSYHADKAGWEATATAVGKIIAESDNPYLAYGALEWIENNNHWQSIPPEGFRAIAAGMLAVLENHEKEPGVFRVVLNKCGSEDIIGHFPTDCLARISALCSELLRDAQDDAIRREAQFGLRALEDIADERDE